MPRRYEFFARELEVRELEKLNLKDVQAFYAAHLAPGAGQRRKLSVRIAGPKAPNKDAALAASAAGGNGADGDDAEGAKGAEGGGKGAKGAAAGSGKRGGASKRSASASKRQKKSAAAHAEEVQTVEDLSAFKKGRDLIFVAETDPTATKTAAAAGKAASGKGGKRK